MDNETVDDVIKDMVFFDNDEDPGESGADSYEALTKAESNEDDSEAELFDATAVIPVDRIMEELAKKHNSQDDDTSGYTVEDDFEYIVEDDPEYTAEDESEHAAEADTEYAAADTEHTAEADTEYISEDEDFDYYYEHEDEDSDDTGLVTPMLKPILKKLIPFLIFLLLLIWATTTDNFIVRNYRENFTKNVNSITDNLGIDTGDSDEKRTEDDGGGVVKYKETKPVDDENADKTEYRTAIESDVMITFEGASDAQFVKYKDGVVCASSNYLCFINKDGTVAWEKNVAVTDPILRTEGEYFMVAQRGGNRFAMYRGSEAVFEKTADNNILTGNVSANGDVVLVTDKTGYKGAIEVYNRRGDKAFAWSSGGAAIVSADISAKSRRVAAALLNTDNTVRSAVYLFDIKQSDSYARREFSDSLVYKVDFKGNDLNVFADNALIGMKHSGREIYRIDFGDSDVTRTSLSDEGDKLVLFTGTNIPMINIYNKRGNLKNTISSLKVPDFAYINNDNVVYNTDREIIMGKTNISIPYKYTAIMDIKGIVPVDDKSFLVIYSNSISMVCMKGMLW